MQFNRGIANVKVDILNGARVLHVSLMSSARKKGSGNIVYNKLSETQEHQSDRLVGYYHAKCGIKKWIAHIYI